MAEIIENILETVKIDETSYRIENSGVRSLLFVGTEKALLVDTGFGNAGSLKSVVEGITDKPVVLVNTHGDNDHTGCNTEFGVAYLHPSEMAFYAQNNDHEIKMEPIWEGDVIDIGGRKFEVIHVPGHTPGSIALLDRENRILVSGDTVSCTPVFLFTEVRNIYAFMASMKKLIGMKECFDEIYAAHGPFPVSPDQIDKQLTAAEMLLEDKIEGVDPPFPIPAKMYMHNGAGFFFNK